MLRPTNNDGVLGRILFALTVLAVVCVFVPADAALVAGGGGNVFGEGSSGGSGGNIGRRVTLSNDASNPTHSIDGDTTDTTGDEDGSGSPDALSTALNTCVLDREYEFTFFVVGGTAPYTWRIVSGSLPEGLQLDSSTGKITGRAVELGTFSFDAKVTDSDGLSDTESFSLEIIPYEYIVPLFGLDTIEPYVTHSGTTRESIREFLFEADGSNAWIDFITLDPHEISKPSQVFEEYSTAHVLRVYSHNAMSVQDVRYSADRQKAWMFEAVPTTISAGRDFLFVVNGWLEAGVFIANAGYGEANVHIDVKDLAGATIISSSFAIPEYEARSTYDLFGDLYDGRDAVIVSLTSDTDIVVNAGAWNGVGRGGWGREVLPLARSSGREFLFSSRYYQLAGAEILNTSSSDDAVVDITVYDSEGAVAAGGEFSGIVVPAGSAIDTRDVPGLDVLYSIANPAVVRIQSKNGVDVLVHNYQFSTEDAGIAFSALPVDTSSGTAFSFSMGELSHASFDVINAGSGNANVKVTVNSQNATGDVEFTTVIPSGGVRNSQDFIAANLHSIYKPAVIRIESLDGTPLIVSTASFFDALTEGSIEGCGATIYPIVEAGEFRITDIRRDDATSDVTLAFTSLDGVAYDVMFSDDGYSTGMTWMTAKSRLIGDGGRISYTDDGSLTGSHPASVDKRFYKIVMSDTGRESTNVAGMYKVHVGVGRNCISTPLVPFDGTLDAFIGSQLTGHPVVKTLSDTISRWNATTGEYDSAYFNEATGTWKDWATGRDPAFAFNASEGFLVNVSSAHSAKDLMFVGEVSGYARVTPLKTGANLVATAYPVEVSLADSGLLSSGFTGGADRTESDLIQWWNNTTSNYDTIFYDTLTSQWRNWDGTPATRTFKPGQGVWITITDSHGEFDWVYPRPY